MTIEDDNDNSPSFDRHIYQGTLARSADPGTEVSLGENLIHVTDADFQDKINLKVWMEFYRLSVSFVQYSSHVVSYVYVFLLQLLGKASGIFRLDPSTGRVFLHSKSISDFVVDSGDSANQAPLEKIYLRIRATDQA